MTNMANAAGMADTMGYTQSHSIKELMANLTSHGTSVLLHAA